MVEVATSLLSIDKENSIKTIYDIEASKTDYFHIDVMDGEFVQNNTIETMMEYTEYIKQVANTKVEVHLMVNNAETFIKEYVDMQVNCIIFHIESVKDKEQVLKLISYIKENNIQVGLSLNPNTNIEDIYEYIPYIHRVLVMSVNPGKGGQKFITDTTKKIEKLKAYIDENNYDIDIEVDGGINNKTVANVVEAGANILVAGNYIISSNNYAEAIKSLKNKA